MNVSKTRVASAADGIARRPELTLLVLVVLGILADIAVAAIPITTIYGAVPAHPLFIHVPVILIPATAIAAMLFLARSRMLSRYGFALGVVAVVAMVSITLAIHTGEGLRSALHLQGRAASLISEHSHAATLLGVVYFGFAVTLIAAFGAARAVAGLPASSIAGRMLARQSVFVSLRVMLLVLAIASAFMVFRTGDLGAKAVWQGRLAASGARGRGSNRSATAGLTARGGHANAAFFAIRSDEAPPLAHAGSRHTAAPS
jgi:hypothetical protein